MFNLGLNKFSYEWRRAKYNNFQFTVPSFVATLRLCLYGRMRTVILDLNIY